MGEDAAVDEVAHDAAEDRRGAGEGGGEGGERHGAAVGVDDVGDLEIDGAFDKGHGSEAQGVAPHL